MADFAENAMRADERMEAVTTGQPLVTLIACTICGVLLWSAEKHYAHAHPQEDAAPAGPAGAEMSPLDTEIFYTLRTVASHYRTSGRHGTEPSASLMPDLAKALSDRARAAVMEEFYSRLTFEKIRAHLVREAYAEDAWTHLGAETQEAFTRRATSITALIHNTEEN